MLNAVLILASLIVAMSRGPTDEELVRRFNDGDREAFSELVKRYQDRIFTLCLRSVSYTHLTLPTTPYV